VGRKKIKVAESQIGLDEIGSEFDVPVVVVPKKAKASVNITALDLTKRPQTWLKC
jgi:hypothetical protein